MREIIEQTQDELRLAARGNVPELRLRVRPDGAVEYNYVFDASDPEQARRYDGFDTRLRLMSDEERKQIFSMGGGVIAEWMKSLAKGKGE